MKPRVVLIAFVTLVTLGCGAHTTSAKGGSAPTMLTTTRQDLRLPPGRTTGVAVDLRITVRIDSGQPIMESLEVTGVGATDNREAVADWVRLSRFSPARRAGQAVEGVYHTRIEVRSAVRRVGTRDGFLQ